MDKVKTINFTNLESYNVIQILKTYCDLLKSHQDGRYKLLVNSCNNKLLSYHQSVTLYHVDFDHPVCQFISYFIKEMPFCGLYCGIITSSYLRKVLELIQDQHVLAHKEIVSRLDSLKNIVLSILEELKEKVYLESHRLVSIVKSCLKPWLVDYSFSKLLAVSLVKATLLATDETSHRLGHIIIKAVDGRNSCEVYNGVIYKLESLWVPKLENFTTHRVHILLFTESLETSDFKNATISENEFVDLIVSARINVIACQKPIHKKVIFLLKRHQIFALERLGEETANALAHLSGAFPISDLRQVKWNELHSLIGVISSLKSVTLLNENYLLMENVGCAVVTLFINHRNFDTLDQLKVKKLFAISKIICS